MQVMNLTQFDANHVGFLSKINIAETLHCNIAYINNIIIICMVFGLLQSHCAE